MNAVEFQSANGKYIISIEKEAIDPDTLLKVLEWLHLEGLAKRAGINESIDTLADEIKTDWWQRNRDRFLPKGL